MHVTRQALDSMLASYVFSHPEVTTNVSNRLTGLALMESQASGHDESSYYHSVHEIHH
jgi:hypothetical protein